MDAEQWEVAPYTEADLERQVDAAAGRPRRTRAQQIQRRRRQLHRGHQRVHPRGASSTRRRCRASTPRSASRTARTPWKRDRPDRHRVAGRRRSSARAAARSSRGRSSPTRSTKRFGKRKRRGACSATSARPRTRRRRSTVLGKRFPYQAPPKQPRGRGAARPRLAEAARRDAAGAARARARLRLAPRAALPFTRVQRAAGLRRASPRAGTR